jgi:hypothetical protein
VYDLVCTVAWIPCDTLALGLAGTKAWPDRGKLERFGRDYCALENPGAIVDEVVERALGFHPDSRTKTWKAIRAQTELAAGTLKKA